ncbi:MAG TPA: head maturation protease, ClpP-related [Streptosporangiaceae bacterium]|jgi:ATP-dependent protease ClpP protease subunit|nr:head maturation protease, ClpP-related [Streptosporangiaceae bacterium]
MSYAVDRDLIGQVWQLLKARNQRPRPKVEGRPRLQVKAQADGPTELMIYDEIGWFGVMAQDIADRLTGVTGDLHVKINSPGGDVFDGVAIYNMLLDHDGRVTVTVDGLAASAASFIAMAGDIIRMNRASQMMIHDALGMCIGNEADMTEMAGLLARVSDTIAGIYADRAGGTAEDWRQRMRTETWYNAAEAVEAKLADETITGSKRQRDEPEPEGVAAAAKHDLTCFFYAGRTQAPPPPKIPASFEGEQGSELVGIDPDAASVVATLNGHKPSGSEDHQDNLPADDTPDWWTDTIAPLTQPPRDDWSAAIAHLIDSASSGAAMEA